MSSTHQTKSITTGIPGNMGLDHVGLVVPNAQLAADFLVDVFDAEFDWEVKRDRLPTAGERGWSDTFNVPPDSSLTHVIMIKCGAHPLTQYVELFEWHDPQQVTNQSDWQWPKFSDLGNSYISFTCKDMDETIAHIKQSVLPKWPGTRLVQDPPMSFPLRGEVCTSTFLVSPWGMWIELSCWSESKHKGVLIAKQQIDQADPLIGQSVFKLPSSSLFIDLDKIDSNIKLLTARLSEKNISWRAPCKAHRCPELAQYLLERGCSGIVVLTLEEAEKFAKQGIDDIYIANQFADKASIQKLSLLAKMVKRLRVSCDNVAYLKELSDAVCQWEITTPIEVLIEININHNRLGVNEIQEAVRLAQHAKMLEEVGGIIFMGITGYEGHTPILPDQQKFEETQKSHAILAQAKAAIEQSGIEVSVISGGGSSNYMACLETNILTEIQAGGGVICDLLYYDKAGLKQHGHQIGAYVVTQVINEPEQQNRIVTNSGFKSLGFHPFADLPKLRDHDNLDVFGISAEHLRIKTSNDKEINTIKRGEKLVLIPGYLDAMGLLHQTIYACRNDCVQAVWKS